MYIASGQWQTAPSGHNFDVNRKTLSLYPFVARFKEISLKSDFDVNRNLLSLRSFATSLKKISLKSDFQQFFHDLIHVYSPGAGADSPQWTKF